MSAGVAPRPAPGYTLVIHPGALGDLVLAIPALRALRRSRPGDLLLGAQPRIGALLAALGEVDGHLAFDALGLAALFADDPGDAPDPVLVGAAGVVSWFGAADAGYVRRLRALVPDTVVAPSVGKDSAVWPHLVSTVGAPAPGDCGPVSLPPALVAEGRRLLEAAGWDGGSRLLLVHPGASGPAKRWPTEGFASVVDDVAGPRGLRVAIHQGPTDGDAGPTLRASLRTPPLVLDRPGLGELAGALRHVAGYLGNDSGISHLAAAVGVPALVLFSAATLAWRPWSPSAKPLSVSMTTVEAADVRAVRNALAALLG